MTDHDIIELPVIRVVSVALGVDGRDDARITFSTDSGAKVVLRALPSVLVELEAIIAKISEVQAGIAIRQ
jgi:hypothetical protein